MRLGVKGPSNDQHQDQEYEKPYYRLAGDYPKDGAKTYSSGVLAGDVHVRPTVRYGTPLQERIGPTCESQTPTTGKGAR